jgi:hypothetical protein
VKRIYTSREYPHPIGLFVTMRYRGSDLLGQVKDVSRDGARLGVDHFNGEPWPVEPLIGFDIVIVLERDPEDADA